MNLISRLVFPLATLALLAAHAQAQVFTTTLSGPNEFPANASPGIGTGTVTINTVANTLRVQVSFSGLLGTTTAAHIHSATAIAGTGTAGVATTTPTFAGFPSGVTSGTYDQTFDMTLASSYNPAFVTANGGTTTSAATALFSGISAGKAYLNIHTSQFGGGEIRGFLVPAATAAEPSAALLLTPALTGLGLVLRQRKRRQTRP